MMMRLSGSPHLLVEGTLVSLFLSACQLIHPPQPLSGPKNTGIFSNFIYVSFLPFFGDAATTETWMYKATESVLYLPWSLPLPTRKSLSMWLYIISSVVLTFICLVCYPVLRSLCASRTGLFLLRLKGYWRNLRLLSLCESIPVFPFLNLTDMVLVANLVPQSLFLKVGMTRMYLLRALSPVLLNFALTVYVCPEPLGRVVLRLLQIKYLARLSKMIVMKVIFGLLSRKQIVQLHQRRGVCRYNQCCCTGIWYLFFISCSGRSRLKPLVELYLMMMYM